MTWKKNDWDTGDSHDNATECSWSEKYTGVIIYIAPNVWSVIRQLCKDVKTEWQMMLCGEQNQEGVFVTDYWIPKQEVTASTVANLDLIDSTVVKDKKIIATIHSHAGMATFFSQTDELFTNLSLIKNHIVVNNKGEFCATTRHSLPCGMTKFFDCTVEVVTPEEEIIGKDNITEKKYTSYTYPIYSKIESSVEKSWDTDKRKMRKGKKKHAILEDDSDMLFKGVCG